MDYKRILFWVSIFKSLISSEQEEKNNIYLQSIANQMNKIVEIELSKMNPVEIIKKSILETSDENKKKENFLLQQKEINNYFGNFIEELKKRKKSDDLTIEKGNKNCLAEDKEIKKKSKSDDNIDTVFENNTNNMNKKNTEKTVEGCWFFMNCCVSRTPKKKSNIEHKEDNEEFSPTSTCSEVVSLHIRKKINKKEKYQKERDDCCSFGIKMKIVSKKQIELNDVNAKAEKKINI
jgi:hypothetical protein